MGFPHAVRVVGGTAMTLANLCLIGTGVQSRADGWRRGAGLVLRGESATFVLSAFGVNRLVEAAKEGAVEEAIEVRLREFLSREREMHVCVQRGEVEDRVRRSEGASFTLRVDPWVEGPGRFVRPEEWGGLDCSAFPMKDRECVLLQVVCRVSSRGEVDLWVRVNHVGVDGVPVQEMMSRLEQEWGGGEGGLFPTPEEFVGWEGPRPCNGREDLVEMQAFIDFGPLLAWRKETNARLGEAMTFSAALLWSLGRHPGFARLRVGTTVEVPVVGKLGRGVGVVTRRAGDFFNEEDGLASYVRDFNRELERVRRRESFGLKMLDAAALVPAGWSKAVLLEALRGDRAFGSLAVTVLKEAKVFGAPVGDAGHPDGFIAIGSAGLKARDGRRVGCVTVKGPRGKVEAYPRMIREVVAGIGQLSAG